MKYTVKKFKTGDEYNVTEFKTQDGTKGRAGFRVTTVKPVWAIMETATGKVSLRVNPLTQKPESRIYSCKGTAEAECNYLNGEAWAEGL